jgi:hypothetical protein
MAVGIAIPLVSVVLACNSLLGIEAAQPEPGDASTQASSYTLSCENYCSVISANCTQSPTEDDTEYLSVDVCATICPEFERVATDSGIVDPNEPTPMTNTLNCRIWHANAAQGGPAEAHTHCPHSGPLGGNMCGSDPCTEFCNLDLALCTGDAAAYTSIQDCVNSCEPDAGGYMGYPYNINPNDPEVTDLATMGNTLNCRMYHLENFLFTGLPIHCSHTSLSGNGVCVN